MRRPQTVIVKVKVSACYNIESDHALARQQELWIKTLHGVMEHLNCTHGER